MKLFNQLSLKKAYSSDKDDILNDFYIPVLENSVDYCRLSGFFSSTSFAIAAKGIYGLIKNNGNMKMIISPQLNSDDLEAIKKAKIEPRKYIETKMLSEIDVFVDECIRDHVHALGWMIANNKLNMKVAILQNQNGNIDNFKSYGIFHQKVGILKDIEGNIITFSGSINETASGWLENVEEFKVFCNWEVGEKQYVEADIKKFDDFWENRYSKTTTYDIPEAVRKKLIQISPKNKSSISLSRWYKESIKMAKSIKLFQYQKDAINMWKENKCSGIFEMATGTGKTFTALGCVNFLFETQEKLVVIITCPYGHLLQQWKNEIHKFGLGTYKLIIADSSNSNWKNDLANKMIDHYLGHLDKMFILTTNSTFSSETFIEIMKDKNNKSSFLLIGDEVHGLGAYKISRSLQDFYDKRLGLSATPRRWFDDEGTKKIFDYFGDTVYEFTLEDAINTINPLTGQTYLTPYLYHPSFIKLVKSEIEQYNRITKQILFNINKIKNLDEESCLIENLIFKRANIIKNAKEKFKVLDELLDKNLHSINHTIIYCTPFQISKVMELLNRKGIVAHRFTMDEGVVKKEKFGNLSEREFILKNFAEEKYQVLVAMKCLDEGVDIPPAKQAIFLASSGNPREYIQRIGRVIRRYKNKTESVIYDIVVTPNINILDECLRRIEEKIFEKEINRYLEISRVSKNNVEVLKKLYEIKNNIMEG